jgi:hypothetical protein
MRVVHHATNLATLLALALACASAAAFDHNQFCEATSQFARAQRINIGTWIDRTTRNDGMEVFCDRKIVHFKRYSSARSMSDAWKQSRTDEWSGATCKSNTWREAIDNGWLVSATVTTASGERVWFACQRDGTAFHRVIP